MCIAKVPLGCGWRYRRRRRKDLRSTQVSWSRSEIMSEQHTLRMYLSRLLNHRWWGIREVPRAPKWQFGTTVLHERHYKHRRVIAVERTHTVWLSLSCPAIVLQYTGWLTVTHGIDSWQSVWFGCSIMTYTRKISNKLLLKINKIYEISSCRGR